MQDHPPRGASVGTTVRDRPPLSDRMDAAAHGGLARQGFAHLPGALSDDGRRRLLDDAGAAGGRFLALPDRINGVTQCADQLTLRVGDAGHPAVNDLARSVVDAVARWPVSTGATAFRPTEARYMRYTGGDAGLGAHVDGKFYRVLVCVFSLVGAAEFRVVADRWGPAARFLVEPGDLLLLRAPGFAGDADGRRRHAVGPPVDGDQRISLTLRMVGATSTSN